MSRSKALFAASAAALVAGAAIAAPTFPPHNSDAWKKMFAVDVAPAAMPSSPVANPSNAAKYSVVFHGEIAGFDVGRVHLDVHSSTEGYAVKYAMTQKGVARWFSDAEAKTSARGTFDENGKIAAHYYLNHDYERDDDQQFVEIYRAAGDRRLRLWTNPQYKFHDPVPEAVAAAAVDPMAAIVELAFTPVPAGVSPCDRQIEVFDGRRRFDLTLDYSGTVNLRNSGKGRYSGLAYKCKLDQIKVAGYREKDRGDVEGDVWVYLAEVPAPLRTRTLGYVPVQIVAKRGLFTAKLEARNLTLASPDGATVTFGTLAD